MLLSGSIRAGLLSAALCLSLRSLRLRNFNAEDAEIRRGPQRGLNSFATMDHLARLVAQPGATGLHQYPDNRFWWKNLLFKTVFQNRGFVDTPKNRVVTSLCFGSA